MAERFPKSRRIRKRREFSAVQQGSARGVAPHFVLLLSVRDPGAGAARALPSRLGIIASRKVGGAVRRNRAKRLVREWFRRSDEIAPDGADLVVIARRGAATLRFDEARAELGLALCRAARHSARSAGRADHDGRR